MHKIRDGRLRAKERGTGDDVNGHWMKIMMIKREWEGEREGRKVGIFYMASMLAFPSSYIYTACQSSEVLLLLLLLFLVALFFQPDHHQQELKERF